MTHQDTKTGSPLSRRSILVFGAAGAVVAGLTFRHVRSDGVPPGRALTVSQAHEKAKAGEIILIDIRRPDEWSRTGVGEGAHPIDMRRKDFTEALTQVAGDRLTRPIALICARGVRSARMGKKLSQAGFTGIIDVPEGMLGSAAGPGWLARDLPVTEWKDTSG